MVGANLSAASTLQSTAVYQGSYPEPRRYDIGESVKFATGPFAGLTIRIELEELQKADVGRRCAQKDRRPLDPPPVVRMRLFRVVNPGTPYEREELVNCDDDVQIVGFVCQAELFLPSDIAGIGPKDVDYTDSSSSSSLSPDHGLGRPARARSQMAALTDGAPEVSMSSSCRFGYPLADDFMELPSVIHVNPATMHTPPPQLPLSPSTPFLLPGTRQPSLPQSTPFIGAAALAKEATSSNTRQHAARLNALTGTSTVVASCFAYKEENALLFIFSDLAVNVEGIFVLRYRLFDIFSSVVGDRPHPALAQCVGGSFRIYSTKAFPGLQPSTDLTKHLSMYGVRLHPRARQRKRKQAETSPHQQRGEHILIAPAPTLVGSSLLNNRGDVKQKRKRH